MTKLKSGYLTVIVSMICWSLTFIWYKEVLQTFTPITTVFLRLSIASIILIILSFALGKFQKIQAKDRKIFLLLAFFEPFLYFIFESNGMNHVSATTGAVIISTIPLLTPIMARIIFKDKITLISIFSIVISFIGVIVVVTKAGFQWNAPLIGVLYLGLTVLSALGYSAVIVNLSSKYNAYTIITTQNIIATLLLLPIFLIFDFNAFIQIDLTFAKLFPIIELSVVASAIAYLLFVYSVLKIGITQSNMFANLIPVFTAIFAWFMLDETLTFRSTIGIVLVIIGLSIPHWQTVKKRYFFLKK